MPIFLKNKIVFIHIPKTGGSSIQEQLISSGDELLFWSPEFKKVNTHTPQHSTFSELKQMNLLPSGFKIVSCIRHPFARYISQYNYKRTFQNFECDIHEFTEWFFNDSDNITDNHNLSMFEYLKNDEGEVDKSILLIKFPNIKEEFEAITGIRLDKHEMNSTKYITNLPEEIKEIVYNKWKDDFEKFDFKI